MGNLYDSIEIDIGQAHEKINQYKLYSQEEHYLGYVHKFLYDKGMYARFIDSGLIRGWFEEFSEYWNVALNGRPLKFHDFFYLHSHYRVKFQDVKVEENSKQNEFLYAWQRPENIYLIFAAVYKYALEPFSCFPFLKYLNKGRILEYGCGVAPITTSLTKLKRKSFQFTIADINNFTYHYAKFRTRQHGIKFIDLVPYEVPALDGNYNAIFLMTVLEHLPDPLEIIQLLTSTLNSDGYLFFDYILSEGKGLDTVESVKQRKSVLEFINSNYKVVSGEIKFDQSMGTTIVQKR